MICETDITFNKPFCENLIFSCLFFYFPLYHAIMYCPYVCVTILTSPVSRERASLLERESLQWCVSSEGERFPRLPPPDGAPFCPSLMRTSGG